MNIKINLALTNYLMDFFLLRQGTIAWSKEDLKKPAQQANKVFARPDVPKDAPPDLKDTHSNLVLDADGKRVTGSLLLSDVIGGGNSLSMSPAFPIVRAWLMFARLLMVPMVVVASFIPGWFALLPIVIGMLYYSMEHISEGFGKGFSILPQGGKAAWISRAMLLAVLYMTIVSPWWVRLMVWPWIPLMSAFHHMPRLRNLSGRTKMLKEQDVHFRRALTLSTSDVELDAAHIEARAMQVERTKKDKSPLFDYGFNATGFASAMGSKSSPDRGNTMKQTILDFFPGWVIFGAPGTGKTARVLRGFIKAIVTAVDAAGKKVAVGLLLLDNKAGQLVLEGMSSIQDFKMICPEDYTLPNGKVLKASIFAPIENLNAEQAAEMIAEILGGTGDSDKIWPDAGRRLATMAFIILEEAGRLHREGKLLPFTTLIPKKEKDENGKNHTVMKRCPLTAEDVKWTVMNALSLLADQGRVTAMGYLIPDRELERNPHLLMAAEYLNGEYPSLSDNTRTSIQMTATTWGTKMIANRYMRTWMNAEHGVQIEDCLKGQHMGLMVPFVRYGIPGQVCEKLAKYRLFRAVQIRGDKWNEVVGQTAAVIIEDEFALNAGNGEQLAHIIPIARSLGLGYVGTVQSITELVARMGKERTMALLNNFPNVMTFRSNPETLEYMAERMGSIAKIVPCTKPEQIPVGIAYEQSCVALAQTHNWDGNPDLYDQEYLENTSLSFNEGMSGPAAGNGPMGQLFQIENQLQAAMGVSKNSQSTGSSMSYKHVSPDKTGMRFIKGAKITLENGPLWVSADSDRFLNTPGWALVRMNRGEMGRYDLVTTTPIYTSDIFAVAPDAVKQAA